MDQACRWVNVIKYFSCLLDNAVLSGPTASNLDHAVVTAAIRRERRRRACVQAGGGHSEHYF